MSDDLLLGTWVRTAGLNGLVVGVDTDEVSVFDPGERRLVTVPRAQAETVPAAAVRVTMTLDLPLPHGVGEDVLRRWLAALTDPVLRERAATALVEVGQDPGPALGVPELMLTPSEGSAAICLCGARTDPHGRSSVACAACGRMAVVPPT